jgi:hypothetical protein
MYDMRYAPLRSRKNPASAPPGRTAAPRSRPAASDPMGQTVGDRLRAKAGAEYGSAWLARALGCSPDTAVELDGYWLPQGPPHLLEQTIGVFAKALDLDAQRLLALILSASQQPRHAAPAEAPAAPRKPAPRQPRTAEAAPAAPHQASAPAARAPKQSEISIGSAEGVRVIKQQQPTIVYRKSRKFVAQV